MCDIHSAIVSCCELPVCMLCAAASCLCAAVSCLCAAVYCTSTLELESESQLMCSCECLYIPPRVSGAWKGGWVCTLSALERAGEQKSG